LDDVNRESGLAELEARILDEANRLEIGPMGFSGKLTLGSCKIGFLNRLPGSFFVTVAYMCWAFRRRGVLLNREGEAVKWMHQDHGEFDPKVRAPDSDLVFPEATIRLITPLDEETVRGLKVGDVVLLNGTIFTGRDAVHKYLAQGGELDVLKNGIIYHCGPVILKEKEGFRAVAAGPTTSIREEPYQAEVIKKFKVRAVIGKGGMGEKTLAALKDFGAVYLHAVGGAAQVYARCIKQVRNVYLEQFGSPEAVWELEVENFPVVVTMDSKGRSLHAQVEERSERILKGLL
jgi:fumarate hydratase class I